jgi:hypothetical protein
MPGFNIGGMGGAQPPNTLEPRRVHRWVFQVIGRGSGQFSRLELLVLKSATRPKFKFEEAKMDHNQETATSPASRPGSPSNSPGTTSSRTRTSPGCLCNWIETVVQLQQANVGHPATYKKQAQLAMLTGMGAVNELWTLYGTWPLDVDWKGLITQALRSRLVWSRCAIDRALRSCTEQRWCPGVAPVLPD